MRFSFTLVLSVRFDIHDKEGKVDRMGLELERKWMDLVLTRFQSFVNARGFRFVRNKSLQADMGKPVDQIPDGDRHELMIRFYDLCWRVTANGGRIVKCCNGLACPKCLKVGFNQLKRELKRGENLLRRASRMTEKLDFFDAMDMDLGVRQKCTAIVQMV